MPDAPVNALVALGGKLAGGESLSAQDALDFANSTTDNMLGSVVKDAVKGAAEGAMAGVIAGDAATVIAVAIGSDIEMAASVAVAAATEVATGAGAGTALGAELGPVGAIAGCVIGILVALVNIGGAKGANGFSSPNPWTDPDGITRLGTSLGNQAHDYFTDHPINPLLSIHLAADPPMQDAIGAAIGPQFQWIGFNARLKLLFRPSADGSRYSSVRTDYAPGSAFRSFFADLKRRGVPLSVASNVIALYCDAIARIRLASIFLDGLPDGFEIDPNSPAGSSNAYTWHLRDMLAAQKFDGRPVVTIDPTASDGGWGTNYGQRQGSGPWMPVSQAPEYSELYGVLLAFAKDVYAQTPALSFGSLGRFGAIALPGPKPKMIGKISPTAALTLSLAKGVAAPKPKARIASSSIASVLASLNKAPPAPAAAPPARPMTLARPSGALRSTALPTPAAAGGGAVVIALALAAAYLALR